ncbi:MAG: hypothetical protein NW703_10810 [Nitrospiraceae bacterium]
MYRFPISAFLVTDETESEVKQIVAGGASHMSVLKQLNDILAGDTFLRECCGTPEKLAKAIDILFLKRLNLEAFPTPAPTLAFIPHQFEEALAKLDQLLYAQGQFKRQAFFHLYNVTLEGDIQLQPPADGWFISKRSSCSRRSR